jgi:hypothetical protein
MTPTDVLPCAGATKVTYAKDQPEYTPLPANLFPDGSMYTEWRPSEDELARLLAGEHIRLWVWTNALICPKCGQHEHPHLLQPVAVEVTSPDEAV